MNKKLIIFPLIIIILVVFSLSFQSNDNVEKRISPFHVTLAKPSQYEDGVYSSNFILEQGEYSFAFVPNGDSPQKLDIKLSGEVFEFSENFRLNGELHNTGISEYYTWDYDGMKSFTVESQQEVVIQINPNGNVMGSVSVDIIRN